MLICENSMKALKRMKLYTNSLYVSPFSPYLHTDDHINSLNVNYPPGVGWRRAVKTIAKHSHGEGVRCFASFFLLLRMGQIFPGYFCIIFTDKYMTISFLLIIFSGFYGVKKMFNSVIMPSTKYTKKVYEMTK